MPTILVVDDDQDIRELLESAFEDSGYEILLAGTIAEARKSLDDGQVGCVFVDLFLAGESGLDIAVEARDRGIPVILASGATGKAAELRKAGWRVMTKPFRLAELMTVIEASLPQFGDDDHALADFLAGIARQCRALAARSDRDGLAHQLDALAAELEARAAG